MMTSEIAQWAFIAFIAGGALGGWVITIVFAVEVVKGWKSRKRKAL